jgi:RNA polymerase sigma-70 factor (ECF subfamily)
MADLGEMAESADVADVTLLHQIQGRDQDAFALLYQRHGAPVLSYLRRFLADDQTAEETLQDTFVSVWRSAATYACRSSVRLWLLGIARRQAMNRIRRDQRFASLVDFPSDLPEPEDPHADPEALVLAQLAVEELHAALRALGPLHREALGLLLVDRYSYEEIAIILDVPVGTVRSRVHTARQRLVAHLRGRGAAHEP